MKCKHALTLLLRLFRESRLSRKVQFLGAGMAQSKLTLLSCEQLPGRCSSKELLLQNASPQPQQCQLRAREAGHCALECCAPEFVSAAVLCELILGFEGRASPRGWPKRDFRWSFHLRSLGVIGVNLHDLENCHKTALLKVGSALLCSGWVYLHSLNVTSGNLYQH